MDLLLPISDRYDASTQAVVGVLAASLDDQLRRLREEVSGLTVEQLEWQACPGRNTIGILLAHLALVEFYWICIAAEGRVWSDDGEHDARELFGIEDDGIPLAADATHHRELFGFDLARYDALLKTSRARIHSSLERWTDASLSDTYDLPRRDGSTWKVSRRWTLYHVLEHFSAHTGQIGLIKHEMRDAGVLKAK